MGTHRLTTGLFYEASGAGPLALFVHGSGLDHTLWTAQLEALADIRTCVAIDLPGHGRSETGQLDLPALIGELGHTQADLVGHSWGGHEVLVCWWRDPAAVRSIALIGVMFSADAPGAAAAARTASRLIPIEAQEEVVRSISVPLLVATGENDTNTPSQLCRNLARTNPDARWLEIPSAGHLSPIEQPEAVSNALRELW